MIRVLIIDDDALVRSGLRAMLGSDADIEMVGDGSDGSDAPGLVEILRPDVVLMDVRMSRVDGIAATRHVVAQPNPPKVLVMTTFENDSYVYDALRVGASGFILKRAGPNQLISAVKTLATTESLLFPESIRELSRHHSIPTTRELPELTAREGDVLRGLSRGLNNAEIAEELYVGIETVKTHVGSLLGKLGARDRTQAVIAAYESGFISLR